MKKIIITLLAVSLLATMLTACSTGSTTEETTSEDTTSSVVVEEETTEEETTEITHTVVEDETVVEVTTAGFAGDIVTNVTFNAEGEVVSVVVVEANETADIGEVLTQEDSEFLATLVSSYTDLENVEVVAGATVTSNALIEAVQLAVEYFAQI